MDEEKAKRMFAFARSQVGDDVYQPFIFGELTDSEFLREYCWVVFASGFRYTVVRDKFPAIEKLFESFDLNSLADMEPVERESLPIRNKRKADGFLRGCRMIADEGFEASRAHWRKTGSTLWNASQGSGPVTKYHLAKNIWVGGYGQA